MTGAQSQKRSAVFDVDTNPTDVTVTTARNDDGAHGVGRRAPLTLLAVAMRDDKASVTSVEQATNLIRQAVIQGR